MKAMVMILLIDLMDGKPYLLEKGESIVMPANHPHAVYGEEDFKMMLVVVFPPM